MPARRLSSEDNQADRVQFSIITEADGQKKTWSFSGVDRASRAVCRPILSCGLVIALIVVPIACILAHTSIQDKVICGLGSTVVAGVVWVGSRAQRWLKGLWRRRRGKESTGDLDGE